MELTGVFLDIKEVAAGYGKRKVLREASIRTLKPGTVMDSLGPNVAGKSTLMTTLAGIRKPMSREIVLIRNSRQAIGSKLRDVVDYVPQDLPAGTSLTAFESVLVSRWRTRRLRVHGSGIEYTAATLHKIDIERLADRFVDELSGGQRRLVTIAQMFVRDPEVILLDELASVLDLRHQVELLQLIHAEITLRSSLVLVAVHGPSLAARYCDELIILYDGHVVAQGSPIDVLAPDLLTHVYGIRARVLGDEDVPMVCPIEEGQVSEAA